MLIANKKMSLSLVQYFSKEDAENQMFSDLHKSTQSLLLAGCEECYWSTHKNVCSMEGKKMLDGREV